eukprot:14667976-Alexandrium_andersonii.AAC.1
MSEKRWGRRGQSSRSHACLPGWFSQLNRCGKNSRKGGRIAPRRAPLSPSHCTQSQGSRSALPNRGRERSAAVWSSCLNRTQRPRQAMTQPAHLACRQK